MDTNIELPKNIELLTTYDYNCENVERYALNTVVSCEIAVFNGLRDITAQNILSALHRLDTWFGKERSLEHCICLTVLTEYMSCAYGETTLYKTFENALSAKFLETLFSRLEQEWIKVFHSKLFYEFTSQHELQIIRRILRNSINKFPSNFPYKAIFEHILDFSKYDVFCELRTTPKNIRRHHIKSKLWSISTDGGRSEPKFFSKKVKESEERLQKRNTMKPLPVKTMSLFSEETERLIVPEKIRETNTNDNKTRYIVRKENIIPDHCKKNTSAKRSEVVLNANMHEINSKVTMCLNDHAIKTQSLVEDTQSKKHKVLNAFDILMKRSGGVKRNFIS